MSVEAPRAKAIFLDAVERLEPQQWPQYLDEVCGGDHSLLCRVEALLRAHARSAGILDELVRNTSPAVEPAVPAEGIGSSIGPYRLLELIGEGGMGVVYLAERMYPVRRRVALKIIKPGMDTRLVIARFKAERQALAMMDHPSIAKVFNADATESGRPYFVMELVHGIPITEYCERQKLSIPERLELFVLVCRAVQHAHQKGVIHRDLKPSNILVSQVDGTAVPKVIDFGVAKATGGQIAGETLYTGFAQLIGTPLYMSPEQADFSGVDIDTRSDIYTLGVLLYELLTGTTPIDRDTVHRAEYDEIRRIIREQEPPTPSARLSALDAGLPVVRARGHADLRNLGQAVRGELDWIVMKALEKDRRRRYGTANDFAADVMRHLTDQPVEACSPTPWYCFLKLVRRNRAILMTSGLVALALSAGLALSTWQAIRATKAERRTAAALELAQGQRLLAERHLYAFSIRQAHKAIQLEQVEGAQQTLASLRPRPGQDDPRGFAWHYLWRLSRREVGLFEELEAKVAALTLSPDGRVLAIGDADGSILLSDVASERVLVRLTGHTAEVRHLAFSPDGTHLASIADADAHPEQQEIWIWNTRTGRRVASLDAARMGTTGGLTFSASGRRLVTASSEEQGTPIVLRLFDLGFEPGKAVLVRSEPVRWERGLVLRATGVAAVPLDRPLTVLDTETLAARWSIPGRDRDLAFPALSADGRVVAAEDGRQVVVWDMATGRETMRTRVDDWGSGQITRMVLSRDGAKLLVAASPLRLSLFDLDGRGPNQPRELSFPGLQQYEVSEASFSPDGSNLAVSTIHVSGGAGPTTVWEIPSARVLDSYDSRKQPGSEIAFTPDGRSLFVNRGTSVLRWWFEGRRSAPFDALGGHEDEAWALAFSPRGDLLATGSDDTEESQTIKIWDPVNCRLLRGWPGGEGTVSSLAFAPDGKTLASAHLDSRGEVRLWEAATGRLRKTLRGDAGKVRTVAFCADGRLLAAAGDDGTIRIWDSKAGGLVRTLKGHTNQVRQIAFSPDGTILASAGYDATVRLWQVATGSALRVLRHPDQVTALGFSPDGTKLATTDQLGAIRLWRTGSGSLIRRLHGEHGALRSLAYSPDGLTLASAGDEGAIRIWDIVTGQELLTLRGHATQIHAVAFSPDGRILGSCSHDGVVNLWRSEDTRPSS